MSLSRLLGLSRAEIPGDPATRVPDGRARCRARPLRHRRTQGRSTPSQRLRVRSTMCSCSPWSAA